jgi:hypothetical protein
MVAGTNSGQIAALVGGSMIYIPRKNRWTVIVDGKYKLSILCSCHVSTIDDRVKVGPKDRW